MFSVGFSVCIGGGEPMASDQLGFSQCTTFHLYLTRVMLKNTLSTICYSTVICVNEAFSGDFLHCPDSMTSPLFFPLWNGLCPGLPVIV